jgi:hypothetical protein
MTARPRSAAGRRGAALRHAASALLAALHARNPRTSTPLPHPAAAAHAEEPRGPGGV